MRKMIAILLMLLMVGCRTVPQALPTATVEPTVNVTMAPTATLMTIDTVLQAKGFVDKNGTWILGNDRVEVTVASDATIFTFKKNTCCEDWFAVKSVIGPIWGDDVLGKVNEITGAGWMDVYHSGVWTIRWIVQGDDQILSISK